MSFRGAPRGRGGSAGGGRGGGGSRGKHRMASIQEHCQLIFGGRGGFQQSYGPPATTAIGKVDEILGPINQVHFTIKPQEGIVATSFKSGDKFYIGGDKLLPLEKYVKGNLL
ncbi:MAG: hypothetical protein L6R41_002719 [Letrouitia leprolyta]|nr:MAG: hypothetical protein L6R41_002719 [Letrouitia leprolyta]